MKRTKCERRGDIERKRKKYQQKKKKAKEKKYTRNEETSKKITVKNARGEIKQR